jgi:DNA-binding CsgD family transcriptional regulator
LPNIFAEFILAALRFTALWLIFYILHQPRTQLRRILAVAIIALQYPFCRVIFFASNRNFAVNIACDTLLFLTLAFICEAEPVSKGSDTNSSSGGDLIRPLISALYFNVMLQFIDYILACYGYAFSGTMPPSFSLWLYFWKTVEGSILLFWAYFYYRIVRNMTAKAPLSFSLLTILAPFAGLIIIAATTNAMRPLLDFGVNVFLYGGLFGTLIVVLNMCIFYLYIKLSVAHESLVFARDLAHTPVVWTPEQGLSAAFIEKYEITPREREVVEAMLKGKSDKEISVILNIAVNTVQVHLKRVYRKTGAAGRFALSALVRGG